MRLVSVVLMAGYSKRMGQPKQHVILKGKTFLSHIIDKLEVCGSDIADKIFVGQANDVKGREKAKLCNGIFVINPAPEDGPLSSIRLAIQHVDENTAIMLWPTDHPMISENTVKSIIEAWKKQPDMITVTSDGEHRGHPTIFPSWCLEKFRIIDLNKGAKAVMQMFPERVNHVLVNDPWITRNLNTPELLFQAENE